MTLELARVACGGVEQQRAVQTDAVAAEVSLLLCRASVMAVTVETFRSLTVVKELPATGLTQL